MEIVDDRATKFDQVIAILDEALSLFQPKVGYIYIETLAYSIYYQLSSSNIWSLKMCKLKSSTCYIDILSDDKLLEHIEYNQPVYLEMKIDDTQPRYILWDIRHSISGIELSLQSLAI